MVRHGRTPKESPSLDWHVLCNANDRSLSMVSWRPEGRVMAQIFHRSFNTLSRLSIFGAVFLLAGTGWAWARFIRSDYLTGVGVFRDQPVQFSHQHHVAGLGIDCRYCHPSVETSSFAGLPRTETC